MKVYFGPAGANPEDSDEWQEFGWINSDGVTSEPYVERAVTIDYVYPAPRPEPHPPVEPRWWRFLPDITLRRWRRRAWQAAWDDRARRTQQWEDAGRTAKARYAIPRAKITHGHTPGVYSIQPLPNASSYRDPGEKR